MGNNSSREWVNKNLSGLNLVVRVEMEPRKKPIT